MKKLLFLIALLLYLPAFAACPVDGISSSCSIAEGYDTMNPAPFSGTSLPDLNSPSNNTNFDSEINSGANYGMNQITDTVTRDYSSEKTFREFGQNESNFNYNSSCQFGVCNQTGTPQLFQQR